MKFIKFEKNKIEPLVDTMLISFLDDDFQGWINFFNREDVQKTCIDAVDMDVAPLHVLLSTIENADCFQSYIELLNYEEEILPKAAEAVQSAINVEVPMEQMRRGVLQEGKNLMESLVEQIMSANGFNRDGDSTIQPAGEA